MTITFIEKCVHGHFTKNSGPACTGLSLIFCYYSLKSSVTSAIGFMYHDVPRTSEDAKNFMATQDNLTPGLLQRYKNGTLGRPEKSLHIEEGFYNQNIAVQARHDNIKFEAKKKQMLCIGTITSFFTQDQKYGGTDSMINRTLEVLARAKKPVAAVLVVNSPRAHAMALIDTGQELHFFDANEGRALMERNSIEYELKDYFQKCYDCEFSYAHILINL